MERVLNHAVDDLNLGITVLLTLVIDDFPLISECQLSFMPTFC